MKQSPRNVMLSVETDKVFLPLVTAFVEGAAGCFGLGKAEALRLTLAAEEVFMHLCNVVMPSDGLVEIVCSNGGYYAQAVFSIPTGGFDMRAFNLTATISMEDDAGLDAMGLVLASRSVDRLFLHYEDARALRLTLVKEKSYPAASAVPASALGPLAQIELRPPTPEEVKYISQLAASRYDARTLADVLLYPGKLADAVEAGEYHSLAAFGKAGEIAGAVFRRWVGENIVECFGPYVFTGDPASDIPQRLIEGCIAAIARTRAVALVNTRPTPEFPRGDFELLGTLDVYAPDGSCAPVEAWFRLLREDTGSAVWVHPELDEFIRREYERLALPREIRIDRPFGENLPRHSVLFAELDRIQGCVTLRPMWPGSDAEENIERHVALLKEEKILNILFAVDLGHAWHTLFVPGLLGHGFEPRYALPYAGKADMVVFQLGGKCAS